MTATPPRPGDESARQRLGGGGRSARRRLGDGGCRQQLLEVSAYLEGDLSAEKMAELDAHLEACECCGRMAASLRRAISLCRSEDARGLPPDVQARALHRVRALLAGTSS